MRSQSAGIRALDDENYLNQFQIVTGQAERRLDRRQPDRTPGGEKIDQASGVCRVSHYLPAVHKYGGAEAILSTDKFC